MSAWRSWFRPAVRIPILLALTVVAGALLARECRRMARGELGALRRLRRIEMVTRAALSAAEAGRRPRSLAELVGTPEQPGAIETLYRREYAGLPEFSAGGPRPAAADARSLGIQVRGAELAWEGCCYRLWPGPGNERDFVIFAWPEAAGAGRLTYALVSSQPKNLYCTFAIRYAGADAGPQPQDLGDPFAGKINSMAGISPHSSPQEFLERAAQSDGKLWARQDVAGPGR